ncbi:hypothetical protein [Methylomonas koyamae]|uniref:hypothetical protein n=1 Tax=Methylomonas koyamae TaxID=702114 RepID=UPI001E5E1273|nr:hypothetical protein [Methylomonas koyamae]
MKQMPGAAVATIRCLGKNAVQLSHAFRKIGVGRFYDQMLVVSHQTIGVANPIEILYNPPQNIEELNPASIIFIDVFTTVATGSHMVKRA